MIPLGSVGSSEQELSLDNSQYENKNAVFKITNGIWDIVKGLLNAFGSILIISYLLASPHCMLREEVGRSHLTSALLAGAGISHIFIEILSTKLRVSGATRLGYVICTLIFLNQEKQTCPGSGDIYAMGFSERTLEWQQRMHMVQGAVIIACIVQLFIGFLGIGFLIRYIRPVSIVPALLLVSIFVLKTTAVVMADTCWNLFLFSCFVMFGFYFISNHFSKSRDDICCSNLNFRNRLYVGVLGVIIVWILCVLWSSLDVVRTRSAARTDVYTGVMNYVSSVHVSYPFVWGKPKWNVDAVFIVLMAAFVSIFEILANYYKLLSRTDPFEKMKEKENRGTWNALIIWEAIFCLLTSTMGTALGIDISLKKNEQKCIGFLIGMALILISLSGKLCSLFVMIPEPIIAALIFLVFMSVLFEGLDVLQSVNMKKKRNLYILGTSLFLGLVIPAFAKSNSLREITGRSSVDEILLCLLSTDFFVAGFVAVFMDNAIAAFSPKKSVFPISEKNPDSDEHALEGSMGVCDCLSPLCV